MVIRAETNGEKKILWRMIEILILLVGVGAAIATSINVWAIQDHLEFKREVAARWEKEAKRDSSHDERERWMSATVLAIAKKLDIPVTPPPNDDKNNH
jgi:hypothetical protein